MSLTCTVKRHLPLLPSRSDGIGRRSLTRDPQTREKDGAGGIRTLGTRVGYIRFPSAHLRPLGHHSSKLSSERCFRLENHLSYGETGIRLPLLGIVPRISRPLRSLSPTSCRLFSPIGLRFLSSNPCEVYHTHKNPIESLNLSYGETGIRTLGTVNGTTDFESVRFNRSRISPNYALEDSNLRPLGPQPNALSI